MASIIRPAKLDDLDAINRLEQTFGAEAFTRRSLRHLIMSNNVVLVTDSAYAIVTTRVNSAKARLYSIAVLEEARGRGLGKAMLKAAELAAVDVGKKIMTLEVSESNESACALYSLGGYHEVDRYKEYYIDGSTAIKMQKNLSF